MRKYNHYFKDVSEWEEIDVYDVCDLWEVNSAALSHAVKKILVPGKRGSKDRAQDIREARDTLNRWLERHAAAPEPSPDKSVLICPEYQGIVNLGAGPARVQ